MTRRRPASPRSPLLCVALAAAALTGCSGGEGETSKCGPTTGVVARVLDGDTIELQSGERIRYLMVDAPETSGTPECYGAEAKSLNQQLVLEREVTLRYDEQCTDRYDRLLAYVTVDGREVNTVLIQRGMACVLHIPPNGADRKDEFEELEREARDGARGLWGFCSPRPC